MRARVGAGSGVCRWRRREISQWIERAREHGELEGTFRTIGESLEGTVTKLGLEKFGAADEEFDPMVHEALTTESRDDIAEPTVISVYQPGYRFAGRVLRPARVAVAGTD